MTLTDDNLKHLNFARRLKTLKGLTPHEAITKTWTNKPERFTLDPVRQMPGLNILATIVNVIMPPGFATAAGQQRQAVGD